MWPRQEDYTPEWRGENTADQLHHGSLQHNTESPQQHHRYHPNHCTQGLPHTRHQRGQTDVLPQQVTPVGTPESAPHTRPTGYPTANVHHHRPRREPQQTNRWWARGHTRGDSISGEDIILVCFLLIYYNTHVCSGSLFILKWACSSSQPCVFMYVNVSGTCTNIVMGRGPSHKRQSPIARFANKTDYVIR